MIKVAPSILAANFNNLYDEVKSVECADYLHIDVMDGHFVPNISLGACVYKGLKNKVDLVFDVHLMIKDPRKYAIDFIKAGADILTFHYEACEDCSSAIDLIHSRGKKAGVSVKPGTPVDVIYPLLEKCDLVLIMTVEPGYGGQAFMPETLPKIKALREEINRRCLDVDIQVDGGINEETAVLVKEMGANNLVAGSYVFKAESRRNAIDLLR